MTRTYTAIGPYILVQLDPPETVTQGGVVLPEQSQTLETEGEIVGLGTFPDGSPHPTLRVGDRIRWKSYGNNREKLTSDNELLRLVAFDAPMVKVALARTN